MNDKTKAVLERIVKLATNVHNLHGRYELSKEGYEELRGLVKEAMECLKPTSQTPSYPYSNDPGVIHNHDTLITGAAEEIGKMMEMYQSAGYMAKPEYQLDIRADGRTFIGGMSFPSGHVHTADPVAKQTMWNGYRRADVLVAAATEGNWVIGWSNHRFEGDNVTADVDGKAVTLCHFREPERFIYFCRDKGLRHLSEPDYKKLG